MLNKYLDLLQHATEAMTSVGKTGAGAAEYFQAVGYEFLVIGLGFLYLVSCRNCSVGCRTCTGILPWCLQSRVCFKEIKGNVYDCGRVCQCK